MDNADAYAALLRSMRGARTSIWISQLAFDADCAADPSRVATERGASRRVLLADALVEATRRGCADVRILLNASPLLNTATPLGRFFEAAHANPKRIRVRGMNRFPALLHAKMVLIDGREAFLFGSPFVNGYFDDSRHRPVDESRPSRELGGRPLHDVSVRFTGPAVRQLATIFSELWTGASPSSDNELDTLPADHPMTTHDARSGALRVARSAPRGALSGLPGGETGIVDEMLAGIDRARSLIYIEAQYLSAPAVAAALTRALDRQPLLEVIVVLNQNPDVTAYRGWQNKLLSETGLLAHPRAGVFALWSTHRPEEGSGPTLINQLFVHSKVMLIDDCWATVGSANLDGVSLDSYGNDFSGRVLRRVFRHVRNFDVNVVLDSAGDADNLADSVSELRARLWSEHLGARRERLATPPRGGWLRLWRSCAARNVAALGARPRHDLTASLSGLVLPYSTHPTPAGQLADLGIRVDRRRLQLRFDPGWLEVYCSPKWVRNMFL
ncbi:MAG: phosphatidylserine/phosphatidylglycerophosphate/cardiolipin synthase family protein [Gemmatimonadota bacterium]|nr:phosphatidylserine/phosphatidylglycerophosphate/cardiolipin synthase family protein [Gemmatimonadota bacterium]